MTSEHKRLFVRGNRWFPKGGGTAQRTRQRVPSSIEPDDLARAAAAKQQDAVLRNGHRHITDTARSDGRTAVGNCKCVTRGFEFRGVELLREECVVANEK